MHATLRRTEDCFHDHRHGTITCCTMKYYLPVSLGLVARILGMPFSATAFLKPPLSLMTPQFVFGPNTKITTASSARALFLSPWTSLTKAPAASEAAMELQQKLRKLCSDSSIADRGDRIEELAKVYFEYMYDLI